MAKHATQAPGDKYYEQFIDVIPNNPSKTAAVWHDGDDLDTCDRLAVDIVPSNLEADGFIPGGGQMCLEEVWPNPKGHRWNKPASSTPRPPIQCNMMPFVIGDLSSIPEVYRVYQDVVNCFFPGLFCFYCFAALRVTHVLPAVNKEEFGKIGYLTIHESSVQAGDSQRRSGAHTESPGGSGSAQYINGEQNHENGDLSRSMSGHTCWGRGSWHGSYKGGIYMASNVDDSLRVWNTLINSPERVVGEHGDLEHVRHLLGEPRLIKKYEVVWMTDRTPHESVPVVQNCDRQYIRLVTSDVSVWYCTRSTRLRTRSGLCRLLRWFSCTSTNFPPMPISCCRRPLPAMQSSPRAARPPTRPPTFS